MPPLRYLTAVMALFACWGLCVWQIMLISEDLAWFGSVVGYLVGMSVAYFIVRPVCKP